MDKYIKHFVEQKIVATTDETTNNKREEIIIRLPQIGEITKRLVKQLNKTVQDTGINSTVRGIFKEQKINNYFKLKDKTPKHLQSNIVYSVKYVDCEADYVGKTTKNIETRIYQHNMVKDVQHGLTKSHITEQAQRLRHKTDW